MDAAPVNMYGKCDIRTTGLKALLCMYIESVLPWKHIGILTLIANISISILTMITKDCEEGNVFSVRLTYILWGFAPLSNTNPISHHCCMSTIIHMVL